MTALKQYTAAQMIPASADGNGHYRRRRLHFAPIVGALLVAVALGTVLTVTQLSGRGPNWTGVAITVPRCPASAQGCRAFVIESSDDRLRQPPTTAYANWSGAATTLDVSLSAGSYGVYLEGCVGYESPDTGPIVVAAGRHPDVDASPWLWGTVGFLNRLCPGFVTITYPPAQPVP